MADMTDLSTAVSALADPSTSGADLSVIAQNHSTLRTTVALHPNAYPGLLDWLDSLGDPAVSAVVATRRPQYSPPVSAPPPPPYFPVPSSGADQPYQQATVPTITQNDVAKRNTLLFVASILVIIPGALLLADGVISVFSYPGMFSICAIVYGAYAVYVGILGIRNAANRDRAGLLVKLGFGLIVLFVLVVVTLFVGF